MPEPLEEDRGYAITVRFPKDLHDSLKRRAREDERTVAGLVRLATRQYLDREVKAS